MTQRLMPPLLAAALLLAQPALAQSAHDDAMQGMQGGAAPADARDPDEHADGFTLHSGAYALPGLHPPHMADGDRFGTLRIDQLEAVHSHGHTRGGYDVMGRFGNDYDRAVLKAEGEVNHGRLEASRTEALWSHALDAYWDAQLGLRHDGGSGPDRDWLAIGVQGLAPYWFDLDATAYLGPHGRTALRLDGQLELLLTQRWVLQPRVEASFYGKRDDERGLGAGLSDLTAGLRLRYEISRQFAPYVGVQWNGLFGGTASHARTAGEGTRDTSVVAGVRLWF